MKRNQKVFIIKKKLKSRKESFRISSSEAASPISDLAFLLLIFFIVTSSFLVPQGIPLALPSKQGKALAMKQEKVIEVYPKKDGYYISNKKYTAEKLLQFFEKKKEKHNDAVLIVYMGDNILYNQLVQTLYIGKLAEIEKISVKKGE